MAGSSPNQPLDEDEADIRRRVNEILTKPGASGLPLSTEREAMSPVLQRGETLQSGDPFELGLPPEPRVRHPVGATIGSVAGIAAGLPSGGLASAALSGLFGAGGEAIQQLVEHATGSPDAPKTTAQAGKQILGEGALGLVSEYGGRFVGKLASRAKRALTADAAETTRFVKAGMPFNGKPMVPPGSQYSQLFLTPAEATGGQNYIQTLQNVAEGSFFGKGMIEEFKTNREKFLRNTMENFVEGVGAKLRPDELGDLIANEVKGNYKAGRAPAREVYQFLTRETMPKMRPVYTLKPSGILNKDGSPHMVKAQTGETLDETTGAWVDIRGIKKSLKQDKQVADTLKGLGAKEGGDDIVTTAMGYPDKVPYFVAQKLRSRLQAMADVFSIENKRAPALGIIKNIANQTDQAIEKGLNDFYPDAAELWRYANQTYRGANEQFNNTFLRGLLKNTDRKDIPEVVLNEILKPQKYSDVLKLRQAVGPDVWPIVQRGSLERIMQLAEKDGVIQPHVLEQQLYGPHGLGKEKMEALFSKEQRHWLDRFIKASHQTMTKGDSTGKMAIQLQQTGAAVLAGSYIINTATDMHVPGAVPLGAAGLILGPPVLAKIMTTPSLAKMFVQALETPASSPKAMAIVGRFLNMLVPRTQESKQSPRTTQSFAPSTQPMDQFGGLNLP